MKQPLKWSLSIALFGLALHWLDWAALTRSMHMLTPRLLAVGLLLCLLNYALMALRWTIMINPLVPRPLLEHVAIYLYANLLNTLTPANLGGDAYRVVALKGERGTMLPVIALLQERVFGLLGYLGLYLLCLSWVAFHEGLPPGISALFSAVALGAGLAYCGVPLLLVILHVLRPRLSAVENRFPRLALFFNAGLQMDPQVAAKAMSLSLLNTAAWITTLWVVAQEMGMTLSWPELGVIAVLVEIIRLVPTTVQGIGVREGATAFFTAALGSTYEQGFLLGTLCYLLSSVAMLLTGGLGATLRARVDKGKATGL
jgi:hypothetical protein